MTREGDIIAAIATPAGRGSVGIVRLSGPNLAAFALAILGRVPEPRQAVRVAFRDETGRPIDDGIALYFPAPRSYTGEDVLELQGHGGPVVMRMLLSRSLELGARTAEAGEFTRRAFENDRIDLAQAEGVADLIDASTEQAARSALRSLRGEFSGLIHELKGKLVELRMRTEAALDFPEEEIDEVDRSLAKKQLAGLLDAARFVLKQSRQGSLLRSGLQVVIAGQPNVGKSSLLNCLAGDDLAIVASVPGTTRDTIRETLNVEGIPLHIVDTAGLRETEDELETLGIRRTWRVIGEADLMLLLIDAEVGFTGADASIVANLPAGLPRLTVFNKIDLSGDSPRQEQDGGEGRIYLSAKTGAGIGLLRAAMLKAAGWQVGSEDVFMARERHIEALVQVEQSLSRASGLLRHPELFAEELRLAHRALGSITGEFSADDLLGEIFSRFCIGK